MVPFKETTDSVQPDFNAMSAMTQITAAADRLGSRRRLGRNTVLTQAALPATVVKRSSRPSFDAAAGVVILTVLIVNMAMLMSRHLRKVPTYDFLAFYAAGRIVSEFGPSKLYDLEIQREIHRRIEPLTDRRPLWAYLNPPFVALLLSPLALLSYQSAYRLLLAINLTLFVAAISIATRGYSKEMRLACLLGGLATMPAYYAFYNGQLVCLLLLLFALLFRDLADGRDRRAGIWLGLLLIKPQLLIVPVLLLIWKRRFRTLLVAGAVDLLLGLVSFAMIGGAGTIDYSRIAVMSATGDSSLAFFPQTMHNWRGFFLRADIGGLAAPASAAASLLTILALLWIWRGEWNPNPGQLIALIFATLLISPHCHDHDFILVGLALAVLVQFVKESSTVWLSATTFALATWALPNLASWASPRFGSRFSVLHTTSALVLLVIATVAARTRYQGWTGGSASPQPCSLKPRSALDRNIRSQNLAPTPLNRS
jgi:hypothetical protein